MNSIPERLLPELQKAFTKKYNISDDCWIWNLSLTKLGYGKIKLFGETTTAHRISYIIHKGPIPVDLFVLHTCDVRNCVNPNHLFLGTSQDNAIDRDKKKRGAQSGKTHCKHGHEFNSENTNTSTILGVRYCRVCDRLRKADRQYRRLDNVIVEVKNLAV